MVAPKVAALVVAAAAIKKGGAFFGKLGREIAGTLAKLGIVGNAIARSDTWIGKDLQRAGR